MADQLLLKDLQQKKIETESQKRLYNLLYFLSYLYWWSLTFLRISTKEKTNKLLSSQKEEIQNTLLKLQSTQAQLIQSEKMASLGRNDPSIAHEIQNH